MPKQENEQGLDLQSYHMLLKSDRYSQTMVSNSHPSTRFSLDNAIC